MGLKDELLNRLPDRKKLAVKQEIGYTPYLDEFTRQNVNLVMQPMWIIKDNFMLLVGLFFATIFLCMLFNYIGQVYAEVMMMSAAGMAALMVIKVWFCYSIFTFFMPKDIVGEVRYLIDRLDTGLKKDGGKTPIKMSQPPIPYPITKKIAGHDID